MDLFTAERDAVRRAGARALHAILAGFLDTDIDWLIDREWEIGRNYGQMQAGAIVLVDEHAVPSQFSKPGVHGQRNGIYFPAPIVMAAGRMPQFTDISC
jgi:hypothetical protein